MQYFEGILKAIPEVLRAASTGERALLALALILIVALALYLFPRATPVKAKFAVFGLVCIVAMGLVIIPGRSAERPQQPTHEVQVPVPSVAPPPISPPSQTQPLKSPPRKKALAVSRPCKDISGDWRPSEHHDDQVVLSITQEPDCRFSGKMDPPGVTHTFDGKVTGHTATATMVRVSAGCEQRWTISFELVGDVLKQNVDKWEVTSGVCQQAGPTLKDPSYYRVKKLGKAVNNK